MRFEVLNSQLKGREFLVGDTYSAADAYLTWFFVLAENAGVDPIGYRHLADYRERVLDRPRIRALIDGDKQKRAEMYD
jgi:glutathione S-transferase